MTESSRRKTLLKEPLIHFLGGALMVFAFFWATGSNRDPADYAITISETDVARLNAGWQQNFRRPPSEAELNGLIDQEITEEIYYREALRLGLDRNDAVIRRRMFTKMRFLNNEEAGNDNPTDADLQQWMEDKPGKYALESIYTLEQVYLGQANIIDPAAAAQMVKNLNDGSVKAADLAKPISLPSTLKSAGVAEISRQFGEEFVTGLTDLKTGQWQGPIASGFGLHLVKIAAKVPGKSAALNDVRQQVTNDWRAAQNNAAEKAALDGYRAQYQITVAGRE
jgi:parvulin-like peptidyl-prolyl isomerase